MAVHLVRCRTGERSGAPGPQEVAGSAWFSSAGLRQMIACQEISDELALVRLLLYLQREPASEYHST